MLDSAFSVALATFNGERFLPALFDSIAKQTLLPCELVACDDGSSDETDTIVSNFAANAPFPVRIFHNKQKLGASQNFAKAVALCSGKYIALADQDDVWREDKIKNLASALATPGVLATFSDAHVVDAQLRPLGYTMWQRVQFTQAEQNRLRTADGFSVLLKHHVVTGATLAFNTSLRDVALPIPDGWPHDAWLALLATALSQTIAIPLPLLAYRQHDSNAVGGLRKTLVQEGRIALSINRSAWYAHEVAMWQSLEDRLGSLAPLCLSKKIDHLLVRANMPTARWRRLPTILREAALGRYLRYSRNWGSIVIDILVK